MNAPTTRETADHAELAMTEDKANVHIRNLRLAGGRDFAVSGYSDGLIVEQDMRGALLAAADALENLLSEIAALRVQVETEQRLSVDNWNVATDRATQAERQRDEARAVLIDIRDVPYTEQEWPRSRALNFLANQGADQ